jgi:UPF0755 protein
VKPTVHRPPPPLRPFRRRPRPFSRARRRRRRAGLLALIVVFVSVGGAAAFGGWSLWSYVTLGYVFHAPPLGPLVTVVVPQGATLSQIADILARNHVVPRAGAFESRAAKDGYGRRLQPGTYRLHQYDAYSAIIRQLSAGVPSIRVTIPEGFTAAEIGLLAAHKVTGFSASEYRRLTVTHPLRVSLGGMKPGTRLEGLLFPATYEFPPLTTPRSLVDEQLASFRDAFAQLDLRRAKARHLTPYDVVIIASMIESEVQVPGERPLVSAVIWNRLRLNMPLQVDATIEYALGHHVDRLSLQDLEIHSPYNTYRVRGLPPTPICNPGLACLEAAAQPAHVSYLYYVARNDGSGRHYFATTYAQFLKYKAKAGL